MFGELQDELYDSGFQLREVLTLGKRCDTIPNWSVTPISYADVVDAARHNTDVIVIKLTKLGDPPLSQWGWFPVQQSNMVSAQRSDAQEAADALLNSGGKGAVYIVERITATAPPLK
jgi:hypothetical protein